MHTYMYHALWGAKWLGAVVTVLVWFETVVEVGFEGRVFSNYIWYVIPYVSVPPKGGASVEYLTVFSGCNPGGCIIDRFQTDELF